MFYAHKGNSSDSAFTTFNGSPTRSFMGFSTKKERQQEQDKIWKESNGTENLIFCNRKFVEGNMTRDFYVDPKGNVWNDWGEYNDFVEYKKNDPYA